MCKLLNSFCSLNLIACTAFAYVNMKEIPPSQHETQKFMVADTRGKDLLLSQEEDGEMENAAIRRCVHTWFIYFFLWLGPPGPSSVSFLLGDIHQKTRRRRGKYSLWIVYQICCCNYYFSFFSSIFNENEETKKNRIVDCIEFR